MTSLFNVVILVSVSLLKNVSSSDGFFVRIYNQPPSRIKKRSKGSIVIHIKILHPSFKSLKPVSVHLKHHVYLPQGKELFPQSIPVIIPVRAVNTFKHSLLNLIFNSLNLAALEHINLKVNLKKFKSTWLS